MLLSVIILSVSGNDNVTAFITRLCQLLETFIAPQRYELIAVLEPGGKSADLSNITDACPLTTVQPQNHGYGSRLLAGFAKAKGKYILTLDTDLILELDDLERLWEARDQAEIIIGSRYIKHYPSTMPAYLRGISRIVNYVYRTALSVPVKDMSSSLRLYQARVLPSLNLQATGYEILPEVIVRCLAEGWRVHEIAYQITRKTNQGVRARLLNLGGAYLRVLLKLWRFRNSIDAADYDLRAYNSRIFFQRYWQRRRYQIISGWAAKNMRVLDIGCGSSRIIFDLQNAIGLDIRMNKLRFLKHNNKIVVKGTLLTLPFADGLFDCVICSEVIEHVAFDERIFSEFHRMLKPGGTLILGTPDYDSLRWVTIEYLYKHIIPGGYADEHITHYTLSSLKALAEQFGFQVKEIDSILGAEVILRCIKE